MPVSRISTTAFSGSPVRSDDVDGAAARGVLAGVFDEAGEEVVELVGVARRPRRAR